MSKPRRHTRTNGGHALRGRRKGQKVRDLMLYAPKKSQRVKVKRGGHVEPQRVLVAGEVIEWTIGDLVGGRP